MTSRSTRFFMSGAVIFGGLMAGADMDRYAIQVPAWRHLSVQAWADYSRNADLMNGRVLYPLLGIGVALFAVCAAVTIYRARPTPKVVAFPVYATAVLAMFGIVSTVFAAPVMLSLPRLGNDQVALQLAFTTFHFWGLIRAVVQVAAFGASIWAMSVVSEQRQSNAVMS